MFTRLLLAAAVLAAIGGRVKAAPALSSTVGWGEWGDWAPCSQTCGGGISSQHRACLIAACEGESVQYRSCCIEPCAMQMPTFREQQCLNREDGSWILAAEGHDECNLVCVNVSDSMHTLSTYVAPGTSCRSASSSGGVCLDQTCTPVGCDGVLGSDRVEDLCLQCLNSEQNGGSTCTQIARSFVSTPLQGASSVVVVTIPYGATSVNISHPLRLNEGTLELEGGLLEQDGLTHGFQEGQWHRTEHWTTKGPLTNNITVKVVNVNGASVSVDYSYYELESPSSAPTQPLPQHEHTEPEDGSMFHWAHSDFTECSASCGIGLQTAHVHCVDAMYPRQVPDMFCDATQRPFPINHQCVCDECPPRWEVGEWLACSNPCGNGTQLRSVQCKAASDIPVAESECPPLKPEQERPCEAMCQPAWQEGAWSECSVQCGHGHQERNVLCVDQLTSRIVDPVQCRTLPRPPANQSCMLEECVETCRWHFREWKQCNNSCGKGHRTRKAVCRIVRNNRRANETCCANLREPLIEECYDNRKCLLGPGWQPRAWGECEGECCQPSTWHREVECVAVNNDGVEIVFPDSHCDTAARPPLDGPCERQDCPQWVVSSWQPCSTSCGEGTHTRSVQCLQDGQPVAGCCGTRPPHNMVCITNPPCPTPPDEDPESCIDANPDVCPAIVAQNLCTTDSTYWSKLICCQSCRQHSQST